LLLNTGAKLCPAAVSATIGNTTSLMSSYVMQVAIFGLRPGALTLAGAALMLLSVVTMALAKPPEQPASPSVRAKPSSSNAGQPALGEAGAEAATAAADDVGEDESDAQSLASFIASELSGYSWEDDTETTEWRPSRLRHRKGGAEPASQTMGVVLSAGVVVASV